MNTKILYRRKRKYILLIMLFVVSMAKIMAQSFTVGDLNYSVNNDGISVTVTGHVNGTSATGLLIIPENVTYQSTTYAVTTIGDDAFFDCRNLTGDLVIPNSVTTVGYSAFFQSYMNELAGDLIIPNSVAFIGDFAFATTRFTCNLVLPSFVTTIGRCAFWQTRFTGDLIIPNSLNTISYFAFCGSGFTGSLTIPNTITSMEEKAFWGCRNLTSISVLAEIPPTLSEDVFNGVSKDIPVYVPSGTIEAYQNAYGWNEFTNYHEISGNSGNVPTGAIDGLFSVSENAQVYFSQGNLQYQASTNTWKFAEHQWDYVGDDNNNISPTYTGWIDLFGWGTSGWDNGNTYYHPWDSDHSDGSLYGPLGEQDLTGNYANADWGVYNAITNGGNQAGQWRTLTQDEWNYLINTRTTSSGIRFAKAQVNGVKGVLLLPDDWNTSTFNLNDTNNGSVDYCSNIVTLSQWITLEQAGVVFLPAVGFRQGVSWFGINGLYEGSGFYWTASSGENSNNAYFLRLHTNGIDIHDYLRFFGLSVRLVCPIENSSLGVIQAVPNPEDGGEVSGGGSYQLGTECTLTATANAGYTFVNWTQNGNVVSTNPTYSFTVTGNATYMANFIINLPELHITSMSHSTLIGGQQATISWTVKNDGSAATPNGSIWHDHIWLSLESKVDVYNNNPILLGTFDNLSALNVGEYYTQTKTVNIPLEISGDYYLFVTTDAYDAYQINWNNNVVPIPYNPPPYISCLSHSGNVVYEQSECEEGYPPGSRYNDNFFYELVNIEVPILPDLQVTSIVPPTNFFSGSTVNVMATISNLGENFTLTDRWVDALYIGSEPDFNSPSTVCIATVSHTGRLEIGDSYQVTFSGRVPLTMYGEAYFFVYTDRYEQVYEHVLNHNNITMSDAVNVILSPPADLEPADVIVSNRVSTGEAFNFSFNVFNRGAGNPNVNSWMDKIYLCRNADTLDNRAVLLKTVKHFGGLQPGASYSINESIVLSSEITAENYYLYVHADADNDVFEYLYDGNNLYRSDAIHVIRPDLQVTQISAPEQITGGYPLNLSYTLTNAGEGIISNIAFTDRVYISASGNMTDTIRVANIRRNVYLPSGQNLTVICNDLAPYSLIDGTYYLIVMTDCENEINESNEGNNTLSHYPMNVLHQPLPDLEPVSLTLPAVIQAGNTIGVGFDITNNGDLDLLNSNCTFDLYAVWDDNEILCPVQSQTLPLGNNVSIGMGQTVHFVRTVLVPPMVTSACSTFELIVNKGSLVPELDTTNNVYTATASVLDCPLPDLVITNISANAMQSGVENQISFTVKNIGTAIFEGSFNTSVYVRSVMDTILCPLALQVSPAINDYTIPIGGTLLFTQKVLVPPMVNASYNWLEIIVDEENLVLEANEENNATTIATTVINYPFDLKTTALQVSESIWAGETVSLTWTVKNIGTCPSETIPLYLMVDSTYYLVQGEILPQPWLDKVYVSEDAVLSDDDAELCSVARSTVLQPDGTYTVERSVMLPYTHLGAQYLLCVSDATHVTYDSDTLNNIKAIPIEVQLGVLPDLRITSLIVEETMNYDRAYWVHYTVINEGERVTQNEAWTDAFYLGETMTIDEAFQLGSKIHHGALAVGETYTDSIEIILPNSLEGSFYLMGITDATYQIYEHDNEDDNLLAIPVTVLPPNPCDLIAVQPSFPATVVSGADMTVSWQLQNMGLNSAVGRVRNAVYLSTDAAWSSDDVMLSYEDIDINIAVNEQQTCSLNGVLTSVPEGDYYVIVKTNIMNALNESSYENNICVSLTTVEVGYPILVIGEYVDRSMAADQYIYYKLEVGPEYEGETLSCTLTTLEQQVANGLYLSHEAVPTLAQYDYGQYAPYSQEIEVLIPVLEQGVYYLLAKGTAQNGDPQQVRIGTSIINFEILHIDANHGTNTGSITTKVTGAKFDSIMDFRLVQGDDYLPAEKVFFSNSTETFTTFDLTEMPIGVYAMEAELPGGVITIKDGAFTIEEGMPAELAVNIVAPASVRIGNTFTVNIEYGNIGTTDLNVSGFVVVSRNGHPISFTSEELNERKTELTFYTAESKGNPDVLRPGYRSTKALIVKATHSADVKLSVYAIRRQY